jgi:hypothetical protein
MRASHFHPFFQTKITPPDLGGVILVAHVGARWNELVSELERWHEFGKAREMAQTLA